MATIFERVKKCVVEQLGVDGKDVVPQASFVEDLGADSLDLVELIMAIEIEFSTPTQKVNICGKDADNMVTVNDAVEYLSSIDIPVNSKMPVKD